MFKGSNWHICMASLQREQEEDDSEGSGIEEQEIEANEEECGEKGKEEAEEKEENYKIQIKRQSVSDDDSFGLGDGLSRGM